MTTGTCRRRTKSSANWRCHEAGTDHADLGDLPGELLVGRAGRALRALLHEVERVDARAELVAGDEVGERLVLGGEPGLLVGVLRGLEQFERHVRALRDGADAALEGLLGDADRDVPLDGALELAGLVLALDLDRAAEHAVGPLQRVLEEVRGPEHRVRDAELERLRALQHPVVLERVRDDHLEGVLDADQVRQQPGAAPAGDESEEHLGQRERRRRGVDRAVVGVERDLGATAEREPVDEHERRHAELARACRAPGGRAAPSAGRCRSRRSRRPSRGRRRPRG